MSTASHFFSSFRYSFGGQLISRLGSFGVNIYLLRTVDKTVLGVANVRLTLLYTTILFLVREPFRKACLEADEKKADANVNRTNWARLINLLWLCPLLSVVIGAFLSAIWILCLVQPDESVVPNYSSAVGLFWLSTVIEACAEPLWILCQRFQLTGHVAFVQSTHVFLQRIIVAGLIVFFPQCDLMAFCIAQVGAAIVYLALFLLRLMQLVAAKDERVAELRSIRDALPSLQAGIDIRRWKLVRSFFGHSLVKQTLTDGAGYIMTFFNVISFGEQAVYDAIERLGSLVARIVLAPLEESAYVYFSQNIKRHLSADKQEK
uniref:Protein RFT1 homolog n=1 Tax=Plectus sambesii TaxID=2011161 RepID=A0A914XLD4_9BILA